MIAATRRLLGMGLLAIATRSIHGVDVNECEDFALVAQALEAGDVVATIANELPCNAWTTIVVPEDRRLTIKGVDSARRVRFFNVRFEVVGRGDDGEEDLVFSTKVKFFATVDADSSHGTQDVNGGVLHVGSGASVSFSDYVMCRGVSIASARAFKNTGGLRDVSDHDVNGGCWYNEGKIQVDGLAKFKDNSNAGGGESPPGNGGAVYIGLDGEVNFYGGVSFKNNKCMDDGGGIGGAIFNLGVITIEKSAVFANNVAESSGAIYNGEGAQIVMQSEDTISFFDNKMGADSTSTGHILNFGGSIFFESEVKFLRGDDGITTSGHVTFLDIALFKNLVTGIIALGGSTFSGLFNARFQSNEPGFTGCEDVAYEVPGTEEWTCGP